MMFIVMSYGRTKATVIVKDKSLGGVNVIHILRL